MTNEEAIVLLRNRMNCRNLSECDCKCDKCEFNFDTEKIDDAEELAIKALEKLVHRNVNGNRYYEPEEKEWLTKNYPTTPIKELAEKFNEQFGKERNYKTLQRYCTQWLGLTASDYRKEHRYDAHRVPVGTVSENCRGEWKIKTEKGWKILARQTANIPRGYIAMHLDGNKANNSPENIIAVKNGIQTLLRNYNMVSENAEITKVAVKWAELYKLLLKEGIIKD